VSELFALAAEVVAEAVPDGPVLRRSERDLILRGRERAHWVSC
jgi:hypothetical protein